MKCIKCGAELLEDDIFCGECGTKVEKQEDKPKNSFCHNCGSKLLEDDVFCAACGTKVLDKESLEEKKEEPKREEEPQIEEKPVELVNMGNTKLTIKRESSFVGCLVSLKIAIDQKVVGKVKNGGTIVVDAPYGNHQISINGQDIARVDIKDNTTIEVAFAGPNTFTIKNMSVGGVAQNIGENKHSLNSLEKSTKSCWAAVGVFPVISIILAFIMQVIVHPIAYGFLIGYAIINLVGLKQHKDNEASKSLTTQNIIIIVIAAIEAIISAMLII